MKKRIHFRKKVTFSTFKGKFIQSVNAIQSLKPVSLFFPLFFSFLILQNNLFNYYSYNSPCFFVIDFMDRWSVVS